MLKTVIINDLVYSINYDKMTANVVSIISSNSEIIIPQFIIYEFQEYFVTRISQGAFKDSITTKSVQFPIDSKIKTIEKDAFAFSSIESIVLPSNLTELKEGWCHGLRNLTQISILPNNERYSIYDDKYIISKSTITSENYDTIVFAVRDIKIAEIPDFIKIIGPYSFSECKQLSKVETTKNSKLRLIEKYAFYNSSIKQIIIPPFLKRICKGAFSYCDKLTICKISLNSKLKTIEKNAFYGSAIKKISIPSNLMELKTGWCSNTPCLIKISVSSKNENFICFDDNFLIGKTNPKDNEYDFLILACRNIVNAIIPAFVKRIGPYAFNNCKKLQNVDIKNDSKLRIIDKEAFSHSSIEKITIPPSLIRIGKFAFAYCSQFNECHIPEDSELIIIMSKAFAHSSINSIYIPDELTVIGEGAFYWCDNLKDVKISNNSNLRIIEKFAFSFSSIESISIPSKLRELKEGWCFCTQNLNKIDVMSYNPYYSSYNDQYIIGKSCISNETYDVLVFSIRNIEIAKIPDFIKIIGPYAFEECTKLQTVDISQNSELKIIDKYAFFKSSITNINIPPNVVRISFRSFSFCEHLRNFDIPNNSELTNIMDEAFSYSSIERINIPSSIRKIKENAFYKCHKLQEIEISEESNFQIIDKQ